MYWCKKCGVFNSDGGPCWGCKYDAESRGDIIDVMSAKTDAVKGRLDPSKTAKGIRQLLRELGGRR